VAVVQISRIQVRRGKKNEGSGLPQLASGEFGWAVDAQELYIGNGSVSEGAPQVGNTRILTANDNIFEFASQYTFRSFEEEDIVQTGLEPNLPVVRTMQDRLDERVSVAAFGVIGDSRVLYDFNIPTADVTIKLQHAINQLYLSTIAKQSLTQRLKLTVPAGHYTLTDTIYLPPYVTIEGEDASKTIFHSSAEVAFRTVDGASGYVGEIMDFKYQGRSGYNPTVNSQARNVSLSNITIDMENANGVALLVESCKDSIFANIKITSTWTNALAYTGAGIEITQASNTVESTNNVFDNIEIDGFARSVQSSYDIKYNIFKNLKLINCGIGLNWGQSLTFIAGQKKGPSYNTIKDCLFQSIIKQGINVVNGEQNLSTHNTFIEVGNNGGSDVDATYNIIYLNGPGNRSENDSFSRTIALASNNNTSVPYIAEVAGRGMHTQSTNLQGTIEFASPGTLLFCRLPGTSNYTAIIDYSYTSITGLFRTGKLEVSMNTTTQSASLIDDYRVNGLDSTAFDNLQFYATFDTAIDTISVRYSNSTSADQSPNAAKINYRISYLY
jgi:hypothetical protein